MQKHEFYIERCLQIAKNGLGTTRPNPMVGAVVVFDNKIIGEGFTSPYGGNHAEVNAINAVKDKSLLCKSKLYVTLEPCSHFGKTPPCSDLILSHQIPEVIIGCIDDNPVVSGKGIAKLEAAGCKVTVGILESKCKAHHRRFFTFHNKKRPYILLKWAETNDGFIAPLTKDKKKPVWITNTYSRQLVHKWRAEEQAILVGTNTVQEDNPRLTVRNWFGKNPIRVVLDKGLKLDKNHALFNDESENIICHGENEPYPKVDEDQKARAIHPPSGLCINGAYVQIDWELKTEIAKQIGDALYDFKINSIIIEGGAKTIQTFIDENLWDEARIFVGKSIFNKGTRAPIIKGQLVSERKILDDRLKVLIPKRP